MILDSKTKWSSFVCIWMAVCTPILSAQDDAKAESDDTILAGHSKHGEAFNDGPRQQAYLSPVMVLGILPGSHVSSAQFQKSAS